MKTALDWLRADIHALIVLGALGLLAWPLLASSAYDLRVLTIVGIYALMALGFQFIFGHAGALALTQGCFFGVGAYATAILSTRWGWPGEATLALSAAIPVVLALVVAAPVLRLESHYFALATLGIGQVMLLIAVAWQPVTGGSNGLPGIPPLRLFGAEFGKGYGILSIVWLLVVLGAWSAWRVTRGLYGAALSMARENPVAAQCIGVDTAALRHAAFLLSAAYAGVAGALYAHTLRIVSVEALEFPLMVACLTIVVVGGRQHIAGAVLGAVLVVNLPEWFRGLEKYALIAYGVALLAMIVVAPEGLIGALQHWRERLRPSDPGRPPQAERPVSPAALAPQPRHPQPLLQVEDVHKQFGGVVALQRVDLQVRPGEILGLIGPNGSGKTSLLNIVSGLYRADAGAVRVQGRDVSRMPSFAIARLGVARTFQNINLVDAMSVVDNVAVARFGAERAALSWAFVPLRGARAWARARGHAMYLLEAMGIGDRALQPAGSQAYGIKRKVEIARALALEPALLLLDEPAAGLNEAEQKDLAQRLRAFAGGGLSVLVIEHNMPFLLPLVDRLACLNRGIVIAEGTADEVRRHPEVVQAYLGTPQEQAA